MTGWPIVVIAVSTAFIAVSVLVILVGMLATLRQVARLSERMASLAETLDRDARPTLDSIRRTTSRDSPHTGAPSALM